MPLSSKDGQQVDIIMRALLVIISLLAIANLYVIYIFHRSSYIGSGGGDEGELLGHHGPPPEQSSYLNDNDIAEEVPRQEEEITTLNAEQYSDIEMLIMNHYMISSITGEI